MTRGFIHTALAAAILIVSASVHGAARQASSDDQQALRTRIEQRFDVVPLSGGVALTPKSPRGDVRLVEISDTIAINGVQVSGRELRERLGATRTPILRLWYLDRDDLRKLFARTAPEVRPEQEPTVERATPSAPPEPPRRPLRRSSGDRVRVFGDVVVNEGEEVSGEVVAVLGSVRVNGEVSRDVVAVLGSVDLGPHAVVHGDVVTVGGQLRKATGARVGGNETEVSLGGGPRVHIPWIQGWGPFHFGGFGPVARLIGTTFRIRAARARRLHRARSRAPGGRRGRAAGRRRTGQGDARRPRRLGALRADVHADRHRAVNLDRRHSAADPPAVCGADPVADGDRRFQRHRQRHRPVGAAPIRDRHDVAGFVDVCLGILIILLPLLVARFVAFGGWTLSPIVFLLVATGLAVEFLVWSSGFGAVLTNAFSRWQATRSASRTAPTTP